MIQKSRVFSCLILLALVFGNFAQAQKPLKDKELPNFHQVNANLYRGGQPDENGVKKLAALGIKTIINLRGADAAEKKEEIWARNAGLKFINIPLSNWFAPRDEKIEKILAEIDRAENQPVFVHCKHGADRTGTVIAVYRITHENRTAKQANAEAKKFGFGWWQFWMKDYIEDFYEDYTEKKTAKPTLS